MESQIPTWVYVTIGTLVVSNLGSIISFAVFIFKCGVFVADTKSGIKDAKDTAVRAHLRIDKIKNTVEGYTNESTI